VAFTDLAARFPQAVFRTSYGQDVVRVERGDLVAFVSAARADGFDFFIDLCAVDYLTRRPHRFELVVNIVSTKQESRLRILTGIPGGDPVAPSLTGLYAGANFYEREAYDLFGIRFDGHPDLTRIVLPDDWQGHPLRKDAPMGSVPVQFKEADA